MGIISSLDFIPSDFQIKYIDNMVPKNISIHNQLAESSKTKNIRVKIAKDIVEDIRVEDPDLTVGWLLSEITRRYDAHFNKSVGSGKEHLYSKKLIVGFKTVAMLPAMDYYLTQLDNSLKPIKDNTLLAVHYSKYNDDDYLNPEGLQRPI